MKGDSNAAVNESADLLRKPVMACAEAAALPDTVELVP
jgi:hypothetical protein